MAKGESYAPLSQTDNESSQYTSEPGNSKDRSTYGIQGKQNSIYFYIITALLIFSNVVWSGIFFSKDGVLSACTFDKDNNLSKTEEPPMSYAIAPVIPVQYKPFSWNTIYSSENQTVQDVAWDSIVWTHGLIAVDQEWAKSQNWPDTMARPNNGSQAVYLLEAYHEIHCLRVMRQMFKESRKSLAPLSKHQGRHIDHCFDSLLQVVMCNADSTPLYTWGTTKVGDGQIRKCKNWDSLRDFASQNSACYLEDTGESLDESFSHCGLGDGLRTFTD